MKIVKIIRLIFIVILIMILPFYSVYGKTYQPELSGNYDVGNRVYSEPSGEDDLLEGEILDRYRYQRLWLKYKQSLSSTDYYYFKVQNYEKKYVNRTWLNNISFDLWGNYTYRLNDQLRNKWLINLRDNNYYLKTDNTYRQYRIKYQFDYKLNQDHDYTFSIQRQWQDYIYHQDKDNIYDRVSLGWNYRVNNNLQINTGLDLTREIFEGCSASSNKNGQSLDLGFKWKL
jgi:hypothetical protein